MGSSLKYPPLFLFPDNRYKLGYFSFRDFRVNGSTDSFFGWKYNLSRPKIALLASAADGKLMSSWAPSDRNPGDDYGGWSVVEAPIERKKALSSFLYLGVGTSFAILLAAIVHYSSSKGFKNCFSFPLHSFQGLFQSSNLVANTMENAETPATETSNEDFVLASEEKPERFIIPVAADSTQQEALLALKKLKIVEDDVKLDELCTKREYARWLVKANSLLERNPKRRVVPSSLVAGSSVSAFDDVSVTDPDFLYIQALAEAGIVLSKLSAINTGYLDKDKSECNGKVEFFPESFITRLDLVNWKVQLEYSFPLRTEEKMSRKNVGLMDVVEMNEEAFQELFLDMLAGDKSIVRKVFGNTRRLQPCKPATKAQAVVALTSGRIMEAVNAELSRLETENSLREAEKEEIKTEFLLKGELRIPWEEKLSEEKARGLRAEEAFHSTLHELENEKMHRDESHTEFLKKSAALDCQWQLLLNLKEEVDGMSERLTSERASFLMEKQTFEEFFIDLRAQQEAILEAKSILEAEKEAVRILRSWVEEEARRSQTRAKLLEEAVKRWKWDERTYSSENRGVRSPETDQT